MDANIHFSTFVHEIHPSSIMDEFCPLLSIFVHNGYSRNCLISLLGHEPYAWLNEIFMA
jgi:hypothetical protein